MDLVDDAIRRLSGRRGNFRCSELTAILRSLGFEVTARRTRTHYTVKHRGLADFTGTGFACRHGQDAVKPGYVANIKRLIRERQDELRVLLEKRK